MALESGAKAKPANIEKVEVIPKLKAPKGEILDLLTYEGRPLVRANVLESGKYLVFEPFLTQEDIDKLVKFKDEVKWYFDFNKFYEENKDVLEKNFPDRTQKFAYYVYKKKYGPITPLLLDPEIKEIYSVGEKVYVIRDGREFLTNILLTEEDLKTLKKGGKRAEFPIENGMRVFVDGSLVVRKDKVLNPVELLIYKFLPVDVLAYIWTVLSEKGNIVIVGPKEVSNALSFFSDFVKGNSYVKDTYNVVTSVNPKVFDLMARGYPFIIALDMEVNDLDDVLEFFLKRGVSKPSLQFVDVIVLFSQKKLLGIYEVVDYKYENDELVINQAFRYNPLINKFERDKILLFKDMDEKKKALFEARKEFLKSLLEEDITDNSEVFKRIKEFEAKFAFT